MPGQPKPPLDNPMGIRIVRFPPGRMATSGPGGFAPMTENFERFSQWMSRQPPDLSPRDFACHSQATGQLAWVYVLPPGADEAALDTGGFAVEDFPGGLYAARVARDNDPDTDRVYQAILAWVREAGYQVDEGGGRGGMGHMVAPQDTQALLGYQQMDLFIPIRAD